MERYSLKKANLVFQQNPQNISVIEKFQEKFQMRFRFCWATVCSHVSLLTTNPANKNMFKISNRNTRKRCDIKNIKNTRKNQIRYLEEITVQNHYSQSIHQFPFKSLLSILMYKLTSVHFRLPQVLNLQIFRKFVVHLFKCGHSLCD